MARRKEDEGFAIASLQGLKIAKRLTGSQLARVGAMPTVHRSPLAYKVVGCAMEVHTQLGPGLLESSYTRCLEHELAAAGLSFKTEVQVPLLYKGLQIDCGYRADFLIENALLLELKSL